MDKRKEKETIWRNAWKRFSVTVVNVSFYWLWSQIMWPVRYCLSRVRSVQELNKAWNSAWRDNWIGNFYRRLQTAYKMQTADCRLGKEHRLRIKTVSRVTLDNMSSINIQSVTQSLFRVHLSRSLASFVVSYRLQVMACSKRRAAAVRNSNESVILI